MMYNLKKDKGTQITIIDDIMGSGKTSWAIQFINEAPIDNKFIFITPFENETERIKANVVTREMKLPDKIVGHGTKLKHLKMLLTNGDDIATTHALFKHFDNEVLLLLRLSNYTLIMDETAELFKLESTKKADIKLLLGNNTIEIDKDDKVLWLDDSYDDGKFINLKLMCEREKLYMTKDKNFIWAFPVEIIEQFTEIYVLTYMFEAQIQKAFFSFNHLQYKKMSVCKSGDKYSLTTFSMPTSKPFKHLITIYEGANNEIGQPSSKEYRPNSNLSFGKLEKVKADSNFCENVRKHLESFIRINCPRSKFFMWTTPKKAMKKFEGKGFKKGNGFVASNSIATNEHAHKNACAYVLNKFMHPSMKMFINSRGITVNEDEYAVSEFVQWLFRSAIRNGEPITVYIPSERMRALFKQWLNDEPIGL